MATYKHFTDTMAQSHHYGCYRYMHLITFNYPNVSSYMLVINILDSLNRLSAPKENSTNLEFSMCDT